MRYGAVPVHPGPMLARLVGGCIAMAFAASAPADQSSHRRANTVKAGKLSCMALVLHREETAYSSLLIQAGAVQNDSELMLACLVSHTVA